MALRKEGRRAHEIALYNVPLSEQVKHVVWQLLRQMRPAQKYVFADRYHLNERMSENTLNSALHRMGMRGC